MVLSNIVDMSTIDFATDGFELGDVYPYQLERTVRQFRRYAQQVLSANGFEITGDQWVVLKRIHEQEGLSQREVARLTYKDPASITRILDLLRKQDLVLRNPSASDRRVHVLSLTAKGNKLVEAILPVAQEIRTQGLKDISDEEIIQLKSILGRMYLNFS